MAVSEKEEILWSDKWSRVITKRPRCGYDLSENTYWTESAISEIRTRKERQLIDLERERESAKNGDNVN